MIWVVPTAVQIVINGSLNIGGQRITDYQGAVCIPIRNVFADIIEERSLRFLTADLLGDEEIFEIGVEAALFKTAALIAGIAVGDDI